VRPDALVTDAGSTKCEIVDMARETLHRCQFLGGHPMAGKETRGAVSADASLFHGRTWVLTPDEPAELETPAYATSVSGWNVSARAWWCSIPTSMTAWCRSLRTCHNWRPRRSRRCWARSLSLRFRVGLTDMTRLAASSYDLWRDILATNYGHIERALADYIQKLEHVRENLRTRQLQVDLNAGAALAADYGGRCEKCSHSVPQIG